MVTGSQAPVWIDVATALGTVGAVIVALYVSVVRERRRMPKLSMTLGSEALRGYSFGHEEASTAGVATVAVHNAAGRRTAEDVEVLLTVWRPEWFPVYRHLNRRRLQWWYGGEQLQDADAVTKETLGPGTTRHIALMLVGHPKALHDHLFGPEAWAALAEDAKRFWREHRHAIWGVTPLETEGGGWFGVGEPMSFSLTITAKDVDAVTYRSQVHLVTEDLGEEHHHFTTLTPHFALFRRSGSRSGDPRGGALPEPGGFAARGTGRGRQRAGDAGSTQD